ESAGSLRAAPVRRAPHRLTTAVVGLAVLALTISAVWLFQHNARVRWAREQGLPQIDQMIEHEQYAAAFALAGEAKRLIPGYPAWKRIDPILIRRVTVETTPPGAAVSYRVIGSEGSWNALGVAPLSDGVVANAYLDWRLQY